MSETRSSLAGISGAKLKLLAAKINLARGTTGRHIARQPSSSYPASFAQERLWLIQQLFADLPSYNVPLVIRLPIPPRTDIWKTVMRSVSARHEIMRTSLQRVDGELRQLVDREAHFDIAFVDLRQLEPEAREAAARRHIDSVIAQPIDLACAPLWKMGIVAMGDVDTIVFTVSHHSINDGGSRAIMQREATVIATAMLEGRPVPAMGELEVQYGDFARWQREQVDANGAADLAYWRDTLADLPNLDLPTDRPRPPMPALRHGAVGFTIPAPVVAALRGLARECHASMFMVTLAAFAVVLQRYAGQDDVPVGTPMSTRDHASLEPVMGYFVNTIVVRCDVSADPSFRELIGRVRATALGALTHKGMPFERVLRELGFVRDLSRNPLFQVAFQVEDEMVGADGSHKAVGELMNLEDFGMTVANLDLDVHLFGGAVDVRAGDQAMSGVATYDAELFDRASVQRIVGHYQAMLGKLAASPDLALSTFGLSEEPAETTRSHVLPSLLAVIERQARTTPDAIAVLDGGAACPYGELLSRARRVACALALRGLGEEKLVGIACAPGLERIVATLGTIMAGAAFVPLAADDPAARLDTMAASVDIVLVGAADALRWQADRSRLCLLDSLDADGEPPYGVGRSPHPAALAYGMWTSGSTGVPKLALNTHGGLDRVVTWMNTHLPLAPGERVLHRTGFTFDVSLLELLRPLAAGATIVCAGAEEANDPVALMELVRTHAVSTVHFVPSMLGEFVRMEGYPLLASLRRIICIGEMLPPSMVVSARRHSGVEVLNMYGPAEAAVVLTAHRCTGAADAVFTSIGDAFGPGELFVLDRVGQLAPLGVPGDVYLAGMQIGRGYADNPGLTASRWLPHPFGAPGERMYHTGDRGRRHADGSLELMGRVDHMVKLRGQRIELEGIEALALQVPGIANAAARVIDDKATGPALMLWVAPTPPLVTADTAAVEAHLAAELPRGMLPSGVFSVEAMPRGQSGKINRAALALGKGGPRQRIGARDSLEIRLMNLWRDLLGRHDLSVDDDFFAMGGHSLLAVRLLARLHDELHMVLPLASFYPRPTIEGMALALRTTTDVAPDGMIRLRKGAPGSPVLFLFPAAGGRSISYLELSRALPGDLTIFAFDHAMPVDSETVEDTASRCLTDMRAGAPEGQWHLGGWSTGATVAFEVAQRLRSEGQPVVSLALFDAFRPYRPALLDTDPDAAVARIMRTIGRNLAVYHGFEPAQDDGEGAGGGEGYLATFIDDVRGRGLIPEDFSDAMVTEFLLASERHVRAVWAYEPRVGSDRTALFRASEGFDWPIDEEAALAEDESLGWRPLVAGSFSVIPVVGNHVSIFQPGQVEGLAAALSAFIGTGSAEAPA